ncbi:peptidoglycan D,D-transpeptidase FtsI family protein, partial [Patescibacteria group bacterium]
MPKRKKAILKIETRINTLLGIFGLVLVVLICRLFMIQVLQHDKYKALAQEQYWDLSVLPARRGDIISKDGFTLAGTQTHYLLYIEPKKLREPHETGRHLAEILSKMKAVEEKEEEELYNHFYDKVVEIAKSDLYWYVISRNLTPIQKEEIQELQIPGVGFEEEPVRYYPEDTLGAHILGFVAYNESGEKQGYFGIEGSFNEDLKGKEGRVLQETDASGNPILLGEYKSSDTVKGRDIVLTIDRSVQYIVEKKLSEGVKSYDAKSGSIVVMEPGSGEIIAMANYPTYHPNDFRDYEESNEEARRKEIEKRNLSISQTYEPGSVLKPVTVASAINLNLVTPQTTFDDRGPVSYSGYVINNWDFKHHGVQTITQLLEKSNNVGAAWLGHVIGAENLHKYLTSFGIGSRSKIELEGEDTGNIRPYDTWTDIDLATAAFGQGVSATPLQVLNAFNTLANGGILFKPKIVSEIRDFDKTIELPASNLGRVISVETSDTLTEMLVNAAHSGEAKFFLLKNYIIAGKTGTAQISIEGKYDPLKTNVTFAGYLANSKKFSMIVKLEEPRASIYAAETAVPLWMDIADELIKYYGIPADQ